MSEIEKRKSNDIEANAAALTGLTGTLVKGGVASVGVMAAAFMDQPLGAGLTIASNFAVQLSGVVLDSQKKHLNDFFIAFLKKTSGDRQDKVRARLQTEAGGRIFEAAWYKAATTIEEEKVEYLASLVANSLSSEDLQEHQTKWLLKLLDEIDPIQVLILKAYSETEIPEWYKSFGPSEPRKQTTTEEAHPEIFADEEPPEFPDWPGLSEAEIAEEKALSAEQKNGFRVQKCELWEEEEKPALMVQYHMARERHALFVSRVQDLINKGLLGAYRREGHFNRVDEVYEAVTPMGMALLKIIDVIQTEQWGLGEQVNTVQALQQSIQDAVTTVNKQTEEYNRAVRRPY